MMPLSNMPNGWQAKDISKVLFFQEGPGVRKWQFHDEGVKLLNVGNINNGELTLSATKIHLSEEEAYGKYSHFLVDDGDLLIACSGIVVSNFHNKITFAKKEHLPLCMNTSTMRFKSLDESEISLNYFKYFLQTNYFTSQLRKLITGSAQLNFGPSHIKKMVVCFPVVKEQKKIAEILDAADILKQKDQQLVEHYDSLSQSLFLDMFGDPVRNQKGWDFCTLKEVGKVSTGNTPPRANLANYGNHLEWIKTTNINTPNMYLTEAEEHLSIEGECIGRCVDANSLLVTCIAGSKKVIGNVAIANRKVAFNQQINSFTPKFGNILFYYYLFIVGKAHIQTFSTNSMKGMINKSKFESIDFISPPIEKQNEFAEAVKSIQEQKELAQQSLKKSDNLFNSLLQKAFKGELTAS